jgi:hypothetical protein
MIPCPLTWTDFSTPPPGFEHYKGPPQVYHCGFAGLHEDCDLNPGEPDPNKCQQECFYHNEPWKSNYGLLVTKADPAPDCFCRGSPNQYDSATNRFGHIVLDKGGILRDGFVPFLGSLQYQSTPPDMMTIMARGYVTGILPGGPVTGVFGRPFFSWP